MGAAADWYFQLPTSVLSSFFFFPSFPNHVGENLQEIQRQNIQKAVRYSVRNTVNLSQKYSDSPCSQSGVRLQRSNVYMSQSIFLILLPSKLKKTQHIAGYERKEFSDVAYVRNTYEPAWVAIAVAKNPGFDSCRKFVLHFFFPCSRYLLFCAHNCPAASQPLIYVPYPPR
jgi:hypothetical protein